MTGYETMSLARAMGRLAIRLAVYSALIFMILFVYAEHFDQTEIKAIKAFFICMLSLELLLLTLARKHKPPQSGDDRRMAWLSIGLAGLAGLLFLGALTMAFIMRPNGPGIMKTTWPSAGFGRELQTMQVPDQSDHDLFLRHREQATTAMGSEFFPPDTKEK